MKILLRNSKQREWKKLEPHDYDKEKELEAMLAESPDILPANGAPPVVLFKSQVRIGNNQADLVGVDAIGNITIVECKLEANREARRAVVAQLLEYASQLWGMAYEEFEALLLEKEGMELADLVREKASQGWSEEAFRSGVQRVLENGTFRLVIAISGMNPELEHILEYVNSCGRIRLEALELQQFSDGENQVLVPTLRGIPTTPLNTRATQTRTPLSVQEVCSSVSNPDAAQRLKAVVDAWLKEGNEAIPTGTGISFQGNARGESKRVFNFIGNTHDFLTFNRQYMIRELSISPSLVDQFMAALVSLVGVNAKKLVEDKAPRLYIRDMTDVDAQIFSQATIHLVKGWQQAIRKGE